MRATVVLFGELDQATDVARADIDVLGIVGGAGISRRHEDAIDARTLGDFPGQGMFAATVSND